ncbi:MAG: 23S rRNA (guanosine(2251)-2'-O)-methyltransferase RlmB [Woeseiaceae bacterium]|jgi:23S rRNA (guanosine2251-2'-O)-methyltransferase|nr:23S rRNA (guanosine(2251)-2'-O)-methyltransferase RlmB [Woeseiaceae bacterium]MDG1015293.1 23S rRNA (guanosine(2251)-2'-O)-methyltransferase RlmB [Woeseiaceae bacterium]MDG1866080.1 23S rRNA (guanosine(2251)-2'-O)-methyltransferase RlmB [Woeseiaceae bacterium]
MSKGNYVIGLRAAEQLIINKNSQIKRIFAEYHSENKRLQAIIKSANEQNITIKPANRNRLSQICGESVHQGIVIEVRRHLISDEAGLRSMIELRLADPSAKPLLLLMLERIQDPHNLGACIRTADAAGVDAIVIGRDNAASVSPITNKVAAGAAEKIPVVMVKNLGKVLAWMGDYGISRIGTSDNAQESLFSIDQTDSLILIMGQEHSGISKMIMNRCDELINIPMHGSVSSLNVSVATGVCLFELVRKRMI